MAIDGSTPYGAEFEGLAKRLKAKQPRLELLSRYRSGDAPLPEGAAGLQDAYNRFQRKSRTNYAGLAVDATRELMLVNGFRTAVNADDDGDERAWEFWTANALEVGSAEVHDDMLTMGDGYAMVGPVDPVTGVPNVTAEDPRQIITRHDPSRPRVVLSSLKVFVDEWTGRENAYLTLPTAVYVAERPWRADGGPDIDDLASWEWNVERSARNPYGVVPVVRFQNRQGTGDFEPHIDLLDRINLTILQRLVITAMQAFRQRATKGDLPETDGAGNQIDYNALFRPGPGALWQLPDGVDLWESQQGSIGEILVAVKDDVREFSAVMRTPLAAFAPDGANQSAEGANFQRESQISKVADRAARAGASWEQVLALMFRFAGDEARADLTRLRTLWRAPERYSLAERADAFAKSTGLPFDRQMVDIWGYRPSELPALRAQRAQDMIEAQALAVAGGGDLGTA